MQRLLIAGAAFAVCAPTFAQTKAFSSPKGFESVEGVNYAYYLGRYPDQMHQVVEGEFRGTARVMTGIQLRRDSTLSATTFRNAGRSFAKLAISMADADFNNVGTVFSSNMLGSPTVVSSAAFSLPTLTGSPLIKNPAVWGGIKGEFSFAFSKVWLYTGTKDFLTQYDFDNGKLDNGGTWSAYGSSYYLDGESINTNARSITGSNVPVTRVACNDPAMSSATGAYTYAYGSVYGKNGSVINYREKVFVNSYSYYTAPGAAIIHAFGLPQAAGVNIGASCNMLYINATFPIILVPFTTVAGSTSGYSGSYYHIFPWDPILSNLPVMAQGAWADSNTGQLSLTQARLLQFPSAPPPDKLPKRKTVYQSGSTVAGLINYVSQTDGYITPIHLYLHK